MGPSQVQGANATRRLASQQLNRGRSLVTLVFQSELLAQRTPPPPLEVLYGLLCVRICSFLFCQNPLAIVQVNKNGAHYQKTDWLSMGRSRECKAMNLEVK